MSPEARLQLPVRRPANGRQFCHRSGNDRGTTAGLHPDDVLLPDVPRVGTNARSGPRRRGHVRSTRSLPAGHAQLVPARHREADGCHWRHQLHPARAVAAQIVVSRE